MLVLLLITLRLNCYIWTYPRCGTWWPGILWITRHLRSTTRHSPWPLVVPRIHKWSTRVSSTVRMFADDCLLYREVHSVQDTKRLQDDLDSLQAWEHDWLMEFNPSKCEAITFTKKTKPVRTKYKLHDQILATVSSARYLGVHINSKLLEHPYRHYSKESYPVTQLPAEELFLLSTDYPWTMLQDPSETTAWICVIGMG